MNTQAIPPNPTEITTRAERTALAEPEPSLTLTQLQSLLRAAAELERAQRPIVLHGPQAYPASQVAPATHPGIDVRVPSAAVALATAPAHERSPWPLAFMVSGCVGIGSAFVAAITGSMAPGAVTLAAFAVWGLATYRLVFGGGR